MAAFKAAEPEVSDAALELLDDPDTELLYSRIIELELLPKPTFHKHKEEREFYETVFRNATFVACTESTVDAALKQACLNGLSAGDALHVACAMSAGADELVTSEKKEKRPSAPQPGVPIRTLRA